MPLIHLDQIFPDHVPSSGALEFAIGFADEPLRMFFPFGAAPTGVVDDQIQHQLGSARMDFHRQLPKLVDACGAPIELDEGRIDLGEVLECVGRTEATETGEGGRSRTHRQKVENPAAEAVDDVGQFSDQRPQGSAGRITVKPS